MRPWHLDPTPGYEPLAGRLVTMLTDTRRRLHRDLADFDPAELDAAPPWAPNTIGTLLYHVAAIELDWTYADLLQTEFPADAEAWFDHGDVRSADGMLTRVVDPYQRHLDRLSWVRELLLTALRGLTDADLDQTRVVDGDASGGSWILHHLMQHEAEHRGQIGEIRAALRQGG